MNAIINKTGIVIDVDEFINRYGNSHLLKLKKKYTICTVDKMTRIPKRTSMFSTSSYEEISEDEQSITKKMWLHLPRHSMATLNSLNVDIEPEYKLYPGSRMNHEYIGVSNPNQQIVVEHIMNMFRSNPKCSGLTLKMQAGTGKSFTAMDIIGRVRRKTMIVVPNTYLLNQWVKILSEFFPSATIGELYGKKKTDGDIIVCIINTLSELELFETTVKEPIEGTKKFKKVKTIISVDKLLKQIGLTIFDESQMYVSKEFRKSFSRIHSRFTIGLSATPDIREDKLDIIHRSWLGPIVTASELKGYSADQDSFTSTATLIEYHGMDDHVKYNIRDDGVLDYQSIVASLVSDPNRNKMLIDEIKLLATSGKYVFVFSDRRSHLEHLFDLIESDPDCDNLELSIPESEKTVILYGGSSDETIDKANVLSSIIFTTYQYSSTGVSIKKMDALVLATPRRSNMTQIINRVFRLGSDQSIERSIVDIVDAKMPIKNQHKDRIIAYKERGSTIVKRKFVV